jgi:hypothetical protein
MPKLIEPGKALTGSVGVRLPQNWINQIAYLSELQGIGMSQQLRELIQVGGTQWGLDLDEGQ